MLRHWAAALCLVVPGAFAAQTGLSGVSTAEACTGGAAPVEEGGWHQFDIAGGNSKAGVSVSTDGFVLFEGTFAGELPERELPGITIRVLNEEGEPVSGELRVLRAHRQNDSTRVHVGWQADDPLEVGRTLTLIRTVAREAGALTAGDRTRTLTVVGEPTPLPTAALTLGGWYDVRRALGDLVECEVAGTSCGDITLQVPTRETRSLGVQVSWKPPAVTGMVAWLAYAEAAQTADRGSVLLEPRVVSGLEAPSAKGQLPFVSFAQDAEEYCAVLVLKDLRTGDEVRSEPRCGTPEPPEYEYSDHEIRECDGPTEATRALWCDYHAGDPRCVDEAGGAGGEPGLHGGGSRAGEGGAGSQPEAAPSKPSGSSSGCQAAPTSGGVLSGVFSLLLLLAQRRRTQQRLR